MTERFTNSCGTWGTMKIAHTKRMTPEVQRIAIAEACGWRLKRETYKDGSEACQSWISPDGIGKNLPDYLNDLNAMHEAEKSMDREQLDLYADQLLALIHEVDTGYFNRLTWGHGVELLTATAAQRAEAFLRTLNLWTEE